MNKQHNGLFITGAISPQFIADSIEKHSTKQGIGGHSIFLGQVRADIIDEKKVCSIEYTAHEEMAAQQMKIIKEELFSRYELSCLHVYHSVGKVSIGEICLFVFTSSPHRRAAIDACNELVERVKSGLPIWGKEIFEDDTHQWKVNQ